ncbi:MAG: hypothetical protein MJK13_06315 [Pseudomonadales bacterium]|nr:hypothetical protein [Pseudomonadales bacterium]
MFRFTKKNKKDTGRVCLHVSAEGTAIAVSKLKDADLELQHCEFFNALQLADNPDSIKDFIADNKLTGANCSLILSAHEYQMLLTEAPQVEPAEMCEALWWRVKDLVSFDLHNAQLDYLELPEDSDKNQGQKLYAVIADKSKVAAKIAWAEELGLKPTTVEIPETAILHLVSDLCSDVVGTSVLFLDAEQSLLMLMSETKMYLSRTLKYNYLQRMEAIVLDLQRSMDYYESQMGKPPCLKVIVLPQQSHDTAIMQTLVENIGVAIETVDINDLVKTNGPLTIELQQHCLVAISGALRLDQKVKK